MINNFYNLILEDYDTVGLSQTKEIVGKKILRFMTIQDMKECYAEDVNLDELNRMEKNFDKVYHEGGHLVNSQASLQFSRLQRITDLSRENIALILQEFNSIVNERGGPDRSFDLDKSCIEKGLDRNEFKNIMKKIMEIEKMKKKIFKIQEDHFDKLFDLFDVDHSSTLEFP